MAERPLTSLQAERLMAHMRALCTEIGPRPATSVQERRAAQYVEGVLAELGIQDIQEQPFRSQNSFGWISIPATLAAALGVPIAALGGRASKTIGGLLLLGGTYAIKQILGVRPPFFQALVARGTSQNVIARIAPAGPVQRRVYLVGHLDSQKQRLSSPPSKPEWMKPLMTVCVSAGMLGGLALLIDALLGRRRVAWWQWLVGALALSMLRRLISDERQPHIEGANDNASAVAVLLGIAEALQAAPLEHTEVTLLFTGCEEVACVGMEAYLRRFEPPQEDTYWIDLEMVGTGDLCYVTKHGVSYVTEYTPHPEMVALAAETACKHPELGVAGKDMLIVEEVSNLRHYGYRAICIAGYDDGGWLPNWHRLSDNLENIEPDTLSRAARYTWALLQETDDPNCG